MSSSGGGTAGEGAGIGGSGATEGGTGGTGGMGTGGMGTGGMGTGGMGTGGMGTGGMGTGGGPLEPFDCPSTVLPDPCPAGVSPGTAPGLTCDPSSPTITASGTYPFSTTAAAAQPNLGCTLNYPDPRSVSYNVCAAHTQQLVIRAGSLATPVTTSLRSDCATEVMCETAPSDYLVEKRIVGTSPVVFEAYGAVTESAEITVSPFTQLQTSTECCEAEQAMANDGPITAPRSLRLELGSATPISTTGLDPSCAAEAGDAVMAEVELAEASQVTVVGDYLHPMQVGAFSLSSSCPPTGAEVGCANGYTLFTRSVPAGRYFLTAQVAEFTNYTTRLDVIVEPPAPATTNIDCGSAQELTSNVAFVAPRVVGGTPDPAKPGNFLRFHKFTNITNGANIVFTVPTNAGRIDFSLRGTCDNAASTIATGTASVDGHTDIYVPGLPAGTFYLVASATEGVVYTAKASF